MTLKVCLLENGLLKKKFKNLETFFKNIIVKHNLLKFPIQVSAYLRAA